MRPAVLPSLSPMARREEIDLESGRAEIELGATEPRHADARIDAQLQGLPQQPVRRASTRTTGQRIASHVSTVAGIGAALTGIASIPPPMVALRKINLQSTAELPRWPVLPLPARSVPSSAWHTLMRMETTSVPGPAQWNDRRLHEPRGRHCHDARGARSRRASDERA